MGDPAAIWAASWAMRLALHPSGHGPTWIRTSLKSRDRAPGARPTSGVFGLRNGFYQYVAKRTYALLERLNPGEMSKVEGTLKPARSRPTVGACSLGDRD